MAHSAVYGMTKIIVTLDSADSSDWVATDDFMIRSWGFAPDTAGDYVLLGEYQGDGTILGLALKSTSGDPIGELWNTGFRKITPAIDMSESSISDDTKVVINIERP